MRSGAALVASSCAPGCYVARTAEPPTPLRAWIGTCAAAAEAELERLQDAGTDVRGPPSGEIVTRLFADFPARAIPCEGSAPIEQKGSN